MIKVQKENVQYTIDEKELQSYLNQGFKEIEIPKEQIKEIKKVEEPKKTEK